MPRGWIPLVSVAAYCRFTPKAAPPNPLRHFARMTFRTLILIQLLAVFFEVILVYFGPFLPKIARAYRVQFHIIIYEKNPNKGAYPMTRFTLAYWNDDGWLVGRLVERPDVFSQGKTLDELEANIREAYQLMSETDNDLVPAHVLKKEILLEAG